MGLETALVIATVAAGGIAASAMNRPGSGPKIEKPVTKEGMLDEPEARRRRVLEQLSKYRKQTLLAQSNQPDPMMKTRVLGVKQ